MDRARSSMASPPGSAERSCAVPGSSDLTRPRTRRLARPRSWPFVEDAGGLQLDSINVVDRAPPPDALEPVRPLRSPQRRAHRLPAPAAVRVLGPRRVPRPGHHLPRGGARCSTTAPRTSAGRGWLARTAACSPRSRRRSRERARSAAPTSSTRARHGRRLVELEAGDARARLPLDDGARSSTRAPTSRSGSTSPSG